MHGNKDDTRLEYLNHLEQHTELIMSATKEKSYNKSGLLTSSWVYGTNNFNNFNNFNNLNIVNSNTNIGK